MAVWPPYIKGPLVSDGINITYGSSVKWRKSQDGRRSSIRQGSNAPDVLECSFIVPKDYISPSAGGINVLSHSEQFEKWTPSTDSIIRDNVVVSPTHNSKASMTECIVATNPYIYLKALSGKDCSSTSWTFSVWMKNKNLGTNKNVALLIRKYSMASTNQIITTHTITSSWVRYTVTGISAADWTNGISVCLDGGSSVLGEGFYMFGAQLERSTSVSDYSPTPTFQDFYETDLNLGLNWMSPSWLWKLGYDSLVPKNGLNYSELLSNWTAVNNTVTDNSVPSPLSGVDATLVENDGGGNGYIYQDAPLINYQSVTVTFSIWLKDIGLSVPDVGLQVRDTPWGNLIAFQIKTITSEWVRYWVRGTSSPACPGIRVVLDPTGDASGDQVAIWGAQLEESSVLTDYYRSHIYTPYSIRFLGYPTWVFDQYNMVKYKAKFLIQQTSLVQAADTTWPLTT